MKILTFSRSKITRKFRVCRFIEINVLISREKQIRSCYDGVYTSNIIENGHFTRSINFSRGLHIIIIGPRVNREFRTVFTSYKI